MMKTATEIMNELRTKQNKTKESRDPIDCICKFLTQRCDIEVDKEILGIKRGYIHSVTSTSSDKDMSYLVNKMPINGLLGLTFLLNDNSRFGDYNKLYGQEEVVITNGCNVYIELFDSINSQVIFQEKENRIIVMVKVKLHERIPASYVRNTWNRTPEMIMELVLEL